MCTLFNTISGLLPYSGEIKRGGEPLRINARAVQLSDGGFQANLELLKRFISPQPDRLLQRNAKTGIGDGLRMAEAAGAVLARPSAPT